MKMQNDESANNTPTKKTNYNRCLRRCVKPFVSKGKQNETMWAKNGVVAKKKVFPVWHHAFGPASPKEEPGKIQVCSNSNELGDARNMLMFVQQTRRTQEIFETRRGEHFSEPTSMCGQVLFIEKTSQTRSAHVLRAHGNQHEARGVPVAWNCVLA